MRAVVSNLWARYAIVPWSDGLANEDERVAHARILLSEAYGGTGEDWQSYEEAVGEISGAEEESGGIKSLLVFRISGPSLSNWLLMGAVFVIGSG